MLATTYRSSYRRQRMISKTLFWIIVMLLGYIIYCASANAQVANEPWGFKAQNRASIAALMRQVEDGSGSAESAGPSSYNSEALICGGGGGDSSATGNSTCIILNNAAAQLEIGQDAIGSQQASSTAPEQEDQSPVDDALSAIVENLSQQ